MKEAQKNTKRNDLPVIALKNIVLFPKMIAPLVFQRQKTTKALEAALRGDKLAVFVTQKNMADEDIKTDQLYKIGTIGRVNRVFKLPDGSTQAEVEGLERARISTYTQREPYLRANIEAIEIKSLDKDVEFEALVRHLADQFLKLISELGRPISPDNMTLIQQINKDPEQLVNLVVTNLSLETEEQQKLLEMLDIRELLKKANSHLAKNLDIVDAEKRVTKETRKQIGKMQREMFLREQMKSIEKEALLH